jgi:hypothetical protein
MISDTLFEAVQGLRYYAAQPINGAYTSSQLDRVKVLITEMESLLAELDAPVSQELRDWNKEHADLLSCYDPTRLNEALATFTEPASDEEDEVNTGDPR